MGSGSIVPDTINLDFRLWAHGSKFSDATGLCGTWSKPGYAFESGMLGRDGVTSYDIVGNGHDFEAALYGKEWKVDTEGGDPDLFHENIRYGANCYESPIKRKLDSTYQERKVIGVSGGDACAFLAADEPSLYGTCVFDVDATGKESWAEAPAYTNPINLPPLPVVPPVEIPVTPKCDFWMGLLQFILGLFLALLGLPPICNW